ncbi:hypothetical protein HPP92_017920 [Vanilla planifolia]|uniref:DUF641 domain-containing protein n=1 Tax=Vanilla planifolia TaxID=51239 RepID=A0A835Q4U0_VANPL|nr:hypothetical protein HPP92_017920 [Vanilla planifolia]
MQKPRSVCFISSVGKHVHTEGFRIKEHGDTNPDFYDEGRSRNIHTHPFCFGRCSIGEDSDEAMLWQLFDSISALKSAYAQLQQAHIPHEPEKIRAADELVVAELQSISEIESSYMRKHNSMAKALTSLQCEIKELEEHERRLRLCLLAKDSEILNLRSKIKLVMGWSEELEGIINEEAPLPEVELFQINQEWTPKLFSKVFKLAYNSIHDFSKAMIGLMKNAGWDLDRAAGVISHSTVFAERSHKKFAFEASLSHAMLHSSEDEWFRLDDIEQVMSFRDPFEALLQDQDSDFGRFCRSKYLAAVPSRLEATFFGNLDQRLFVQSGGHPRTPFYEAFVKMSRRLWVLQVIAHSFIPKAEIFYVKKGTKFSKDYMESVVSPSQIDVSCEELKPEVGFTVMPGFRIGSHIDRCKVYICRMNSLKKSSGL